MPSIGVSGIVAALYAQPRISVIDEYVGQVAGWNRLRDDRERVDASAAQACVTGGGAHEKHARHCRIRNRCDRQRSAMNDEVAASWSKERCTRH